MFLRVDYCNTVLILSVCLFALVVEEFLASIHKYRLDTAEGIHAIPLGAHTRDDEQVTDPFMRCIDIVGHPNNLETEKMFFPFTLLLVLIISSST